MWPIVIKLTHWHPLYLLGVETQLKSWKTKCEKAAENVNLLLLSLWMKIRNLCQNLPNVLHQESISTVQEDGCMTRLFHHNIMLAINDPSYGVLRTVQICQRLCNIQIFKINVDGINLSTMWVRLNLSVMVNNCILCKEKRCH